MAPLPKRRHSTARQGKRENARTVGKVTLVKCPSCGQPKKPHTVCLSCGQYDSRIIFAKKEKKKKHEETR